MIDLPVAASDEEDEELESDETGTSIEAEEKAVETQIVTDVDVTLRRTSLLKLSWRRRKLKSIYPKRLLALKILYYNRILMCRPNHQYRKRLSRFL